jgi:hypothetical protein
MLVIFLYKWSFWLMSLMHPYYVSVSEVEYISKTQEMGISFKFFTDDLEDALKAESTDKVNLLSGDKAINQKLIEAYVTRHFSIYTDKTPVKLRFLGLEHDKEATWCYVEADNIKAFKNVSIRADFLYATKKEQVNIFHITVNGNRKSRRLVHPDQSFDESF